jgi:hypothetical protein
LECINLREIIEVKKGKEFFEFSFPNGSDWVDWERGAIISLGKSSFLINFKNFINLINYFTSTIFFTALKLSAVSL